MALLRLDLVLRPIGQRARRSALALATACALCAALMPVLGCGAATEAPPSILFVTIDTLRADRVSAYGYAKPTTPSLDALAARGTRFEFALSPSSSTAPTHASIFTGLAPSFHSIGAYNSQFALAADEVTLAERLSEAGYRTAAIVSNPLLGRALGLDQGFAHYDDDTTGEGQFAAKGRIAEHAVDRAIAWLDANAEQRFFLWLHVQDAHGPYAAPPDWNCPLATPPSKEPTRLDVGRDQSGFRALPVYQVWNRERELSAYAQRYDCEIAYLDFELGRVFERAKSDPALANLLIVVTADHGEAIGEDDFYFAHGHGIGLDQTRVPLILAGPGVSRDRVVDAPVGLGSLFGTLLGSAGIAGEAEPSLWPLLRGAAEPPTVFVESLNQVGIARGDVFLRRDLEARDNAAFWEAGNPNAGGAHWEPLPEEEIVLLRADAGLESVPSLRKELDVHAAAIRARRASFGRERPTPELTEEQRRALRSLGYAN